LLCSNHSYKYNSSQNKEINMKRVFLPSHPITFFFLLTFLITWVLLLPLVFTGLGLFGFHVSEQWHFLGALGPALSALIVTYLTKGKEGWHEYFQRLRRWREVKSIWRTIAVLSPLVFFAVGLIAAILMEKPANFPKLSSLEYSNIPWIGGTLLLSSLAYGFGEEMGWRGFALPRLQHGRSALSATLILAVFWALWHIPMFFYRFEFGIGQVIGFFIGLLAGAIWMTCLYNSTGGSTLANALWHTIWNMVNIIGLVISEETVAVMSTLIMVAAVLIVIVWKPARLSPARPHTIE
jgi:membrane protease YdiL (CAAX protease family)